MHHVSSRALRVRLGTKRTKQHAHCIAGICVGRNESPFVGDHRFLSKVSDFRSPTLSRKLCFSKYPPPRLFASSSACTDASAEVCDFQSIADWNQLQPKRRTDWRERGLTFSSVVIFLPLSNAADMDSSDCLGFRLAGAFPLTLFTVLGALTSADAEAEEGVVRPVSPAVLLSAGAESFAPDEEGPGAASTTPSAAPVAVSMCAFAVCRSICSGVAVAVLCVDVAGPPSLASY